MIKIDTEKNQMKVVGSLKEFIIDMANIICSTLDNAIDHDAQEDLKKAMLLAYKLAEDTYTEKKS